VTGYYGWLTRSMEFSTDAGTTYYMLVRQTVVAYDIKTTFGISLQPAVPAAAPTSTGRCRRFGCRIGRLFRRIFGIFA
jgi:hypothetical protein